MPSPTPRIGYQKPSGSESFTRTSLTDFMDRADEYADWLADNYDSDVVVTRVGGVITKIETKLPNSGGNVRVESVPTRVNGVLMSLRKKVFDSAGGLVADSIMTPVRSGGQIARIEGRVQI